MNLAPPLQSTTVDRAPDIYRHSLKVVGPETWLAPITQPPTRLGSDGRITGES